MATPFKMKGGVGSSPAKYITGSNPAAIRAEDERRRRVLEAEKRKREEQEALEQSRTDWIDQSMEAGSASQHEKAHQHSAAFDDYLGHKIGDTNDRIDALEKSVPVHGHESHGNVNMGRGEPKEIDASANPITGVVPSDVDDGSPMTYKMPAAGKYKNSPIEKNYGSPAQRGFQSPLDLKSFGVGGLKGGVYGKSQAKTGIAASPNKFILPVAAAIVGGKILKKGVKKIKSMVEDKGKELLGTFMPKSPF